MTVLEKMRENRARNKAARQNLRLVKARRRDPDALDFGMFMLVDASANTVVYGAGPFGCDATIDEIETYLSPRTATEAP